jgi:hypothetical protein
MTDPESIHDRLARLEAGVAAPIHRWWHHAFAVAGIGAVVAVIIAVLWLASSVKNRIDRGRELLQAAQPVTVAAAAPVLSPGELAARFGLDLAKLSKAPTVDQAALNRAAAAGAAAALAAQRKAAKGGDATAGQSFDPTRQPAGPSAAGSAGAPGAACIPLPAPGAQFYYAEKKISPEQGRWGATALPLLNPDNSLELLIKADPRPRFHLGGLSRAGGEWDPLVQHKVGLFLEKDLVSVGIGSNESCAAKSWRCGRALVLGARPYASYGYNVQPGAKASDYGVPITLAIDF